MLTAKLWTLIWPLSTKPKVRYVFFVVIHPKIYLLKLQLVCAFFLCFVVVEGRDVYKKLTAYGTLSAYEMSHFVL